MTRSAALLAALALGLPAAPLSAADPDKSAKKAAKKGTHVGHMVFFTLKDPTPEGRQKLVAACKQYLENHEGVLYFAAGVRGEEFKREVNDREWDVALHLVFADKAAYDKYEAHPEHLKFIEENKAAWGKVRVFDSEFTGAAKKPKKAADEAK